MVTALILQLVQCMVIINNQDANGVSMETKGTGSKKDKSQVGRLWRVVHIPIHIYMWYIMWYIMWCIMWFSRLLLMLQWSVATSWLLGLDQISYHHFWESKKYVIRRDWGRQTGKYQFICVCTWYTCTCTCTM